MKLSVYKKASYSAKSKEDKNQLALLCSKPNVPDIVEINTDSDLIAAVTSYAWSPSIFSGIRHGDNFISCDFLAVDFDSGYKIEEAEAVVQKEGLCAVCLPSSSHTSEHHKFRLIFPLSKTIFNKDVYDSTWEYVRKMFPMLDESCSDYARFYIRSSMDDGFFQDGELLSPFYPTPKKEVDVRLKNEKFQVDVSDGIKGLVRSLYGKDRERVPEAVSFFLENAPSGLSGLWINSLNSCCFSLGLSGVEEDVIIEVLETISPSPLDKKDLYQIHRAVRDGNKNRESSDI